MKLKRESKDYIVKPPSFGVTNRLTMAIIFILEERLTKSPCPDFLIEKTLVTIMLFMLMILMNGEVMHVIKE